MIEFEKVLGAFSHLAELDASAARKEEVLVHLAIAEVGTKLRADACTPEDHDRICHACAAFAYYKYALVQATRCDTFAVGDMHISAPNAATVLTAKQLRDDALGAIADLLEESDFAFLEV